jgi:hypothetical protein
VFLSNSGGLSFEKIADFAPIAEFHSYSFNLAALAAERGISLNEYCVLKFQDYLEPGETTLLDDVSIVDQVQVAQIPFYDQFSQSLLANHWTTNSTGDGVIEVKLSDTNLYMHGGPSQIGYDLNQLVLHVDMVNVDNAILSWDWQSNGNENHSNNGVFLSADNGATYVKVFDLNTAEPFQFHHESLSLTNLIEDNDLCKSPNFLIKFQQYGKSGPPFAGGIEISYVRISESAFGGDYTSLPLNEDFENALDSYWQTQFSAQGGQVNISNLNSYPDFCTESKLLMRLSPYGAPASLNEAMVGIDLNNVESPVTLSFLYRNNYGAVVDPASGLFMSDDDGEFIKVANFSGSNTEYVYHTYDLAALAQTYGLDLTSTMVIKFAENHQAGNWALFDNVIIDNSTIANAPFQDGFPSSRLGDHWTKQSSGDGVVKASASYGPHTGTYHMVMYPGPSQVGYDKNEAWLHTDVTDATQLQLSFDWKSLNTSYSIFNGVSLSDDGGASFSKVYDLNTSKHNVYHSVSLNLTDLMGAWGLCPTRDFIIKFQQYGKFGPPLAGGLTFDNIAVESIPIVGLELLEAPPQIDVTESELSSYGVYPNPIVDGQDLTVRTNGAGSVRLTNSTGKLIVELKVSDQEEIIVSNKFFQNDGLYFVVISTDFGKITATKVIKGQNR